VLLPSLHALLPHGCCPLLCLLLTITASWLLESECFGVTTINAVASFCCSRITFSFLVSRHWPLTALFAHAEWPHLPPLLLLLPHWIITNLFLKISLLLYPSLIAYCTTTAVLTSCHHYAMLLPPPRCHLLLLVSQMIVDFYCCACYHCSLCHSAITRATTASTTEAVASAPVSLAIASCDHATGTCFQKPLLFLQQGYCCFYSDATAVATATIAVPTTVVAASQLLHCLQKDASWPPADC